MPTWSRAIDFETAAVSSIAWTGTAAGQTGENWFVPSLRGSYAPSTSHLSAAGPDGRARPRRHVNAAQDLKKRRAAASYAMPLVDVHKNSLRSSRGRRYAVLLPFSLLGKVCPGIVADALVRPTARDTGADRSAMGGIRHGPASRPCHPARRSRRARAGRAVRAAARRHGP